MHTQYKHIPIKRSLINILFVPIAAGFLAAIEPYACAHDSDTEGALKQTLKMQYADLLAEMQLMPGIEKQFFKLLASDFTISKKDHLDIRVTDPDLIKKFNAAGKIYGKKKIAEVIADPEQLAVIEDLHKALQQKGITEDPRALLKSTNLVAAAEQDWLLKKKQLYSKLKTLLGEVNYSKFCAYERAFWESALICGCLKDHKTALNPAQKKVVLMALRDIRHGPDLAEVSPLTPPDRKVRDEENLQILARCQGELSSQQCALLERLFARDSSVLEMRKPYGEIQWSSPAVRYRY